VSAFTLVDSYSSQFRPMSDNIVQPASKLLSSKWSHETKNVFFPQKKEERIGSLGHKS
jgi:hypothetical protein